MYEENKREKDEEEAGEKEERAETRSKAVKGK
jgi:hypothetical protein